MPIPCLNIAIARLSQADAPSLAIWVTESPLPMGYALQDTLWPESLTRQWMAWQEMFSTSAKLHQPYPITSTQLEGTETSSLRCKDTPPPQYGEANPQKSYGGRLMQTLGVGLWQWVFNDVIRQSFAQSCGLAIGQQQTLRLRLEIQAPNLVPLPWEIMQPEMGTQAITLNSQILFSRTISKVDPLSPQTSRNSICILLVLGEQKRDAKVGNKLDLDKEAELLREVIEESYKSQEYGNKVKIEVDFLIQPTSAQLIEALDDGVYNVIFYAGHGMPGPDGGLLFLSTNTTLNGTELAQVLVRNRITLAVFNACWLAKPAQEDSQVIERSSLAEVLICHGVPAVLGMRDSIADQEALGFIQVFTKALTGRIPLDRAVQVARQQLLTLYGFNQPAWTLPILYMHPQFDGLLVSPTNDEDITILPDNDDNRVVDPYPVAYFRALNRRDEQWRMYGGLMRIGRRTENDLVIPEPWVSQYHAEVICRTEDNCTYNYILKDRSRFGTLIFVKGQWQKVHNEDIPIISGIQVKFGSDGGQVFEFIIESF